MRPRLGFGKPFFLLGVLTFVVLTAAGAALAREKEEDSGRQSRSFHMAVQFPAVTVDAGEDVAMDLIFYNKGKSHENVRVWIAAAPQDWKTAIKTYRYAVSGVHVPAGEDRTLTFEAEPPKDVAPGSYAFEIAASTGDGEKTIKQAIAIEVKEKQEAKKEKGVRLTTSYPVLRGPSDTKFEFSFEVESKVDKDSVFDLFAQVPEGWEAGFKPAYESKTISSLRLKGNQSQTVAVEVKPPANAKAGEYPLTVKVSSAEASAEAQLTVVLTGTYSLEAATATGLLSLDAGQGRPATVSVYVKNNGTAVNNNIGFLSFKPENWKVEFKPEKIDAIEPGEFKQVEIAITPNEEALLGDYAVSVKIDGEKATQTMELRVTVKASAAWGWIGIGIIAVVIGVLLYLFKKFGRR